ncbi:HAMP domain-containing sensor histidine kinase [uncultured Slackia sp.]|uniref:sensor histidine kinase n=1 Tax=uncultured Slackia sp. TaxID=665903 RepID=UPI0025DF45AC|nr:HAMP domain-containing sensor histidine kinase [uncultured Slackia sp.]
MADVNNPVQSLQSTAANHSQATGTPERAYRRGMPLWLVVVRYFIYCIVVIGALALSLILGFSIFMNMEVVYPANYGANHVDETLDQVSSQAAFDASAIPSAYWYAHISADGEVLATDMNERQLSTALTLVRQGQDLGTAEPASDYDLYTAIQPQQLADGSWCALGYELAPQFTSRDLRDALPNPQNMLIALAALLGIAILILFAVRASRVITRKMQPLVDAASSIGRQELDFTVGTSNVRQINDILGAMENMRVSLATSLEAQWRGEEAQRAQVAALAHDLKTPLTVVEANADYLAEDERLEADAREAADAVASGARRLNDAVQAVIEAARGHAAQPRFASVDAHAFAADIAHQAEEFARTAGVHISAEIALPRDAAFDADRVQLERAVMNLVTNAVEHSPIGGTVRLAFELEDVRTDDGIQRGTRINAHEQNRLRITVEDEGSGFSPAALERGCERFFRDDDARSQSDATATDEGRQESDNREEPTACENTISAPAPSASVPRASAPHYGIGLATASDIARAHSGTLTLENRTDESGRIAGARVTLRIPARQ